MRAINIHLTLLINFTTMNPADQCRHTFAFRSTSEETKKVYIIKEKEKLGRTDTNSLLLWQLCNLTQN